MKRIYYFLLACILMTLVACETTTCETTTKVDVYFCNKLDNNINLEVFKNNEKTNFELVPNKKVYFGSFKFSMDPHVKYNQFPGILAYDEFLYDIDTLNVLYNSKKYTYTQKDSIRWVLYPDEFWLVVFDEKQKEELGWK